MARKLQTNPKKPGARKKDDHNLVRFGVSLPQELLKKYDRHIKREKYSNRSEAIRDLIREKLVETDWNVGEGQVAGTITLVYDHHTRGLSSKLIKLQHEFQEAILSTQHIHLDHDNCLEVIVVRDNPARARKLANSLHSTRGVKHCQLTMATTGKNLD